MTELSLRDRVPKFGNPNLGGIVSIMNKNNIVSLGAAEQIQNRGTFVIGITDKMSSPLCQHCDSIFIVSTETPQFFTSHAATLVLIESLVGLVVSYSDDSVSQRIASVEATGHKIGDYFPKS